MPSDLFQGLNVLVVGPQNDETLGFEKMLKNNGCDSVPLYNTDTGEELTDKSAIISYFKLEETDIHFIVSNTCDFSFYKVMAFDLYIPVVKSSWIIHCIAKNKIVQPETHSPNGTHHLKNTQIYLSPFSFTEGEIAFYSQMIVSLGGSINQILSTRTTHVIANQHEDLAISAVEVFPGTAAAKIKFVYVTWLVECFMSCSDVGTAEHTITEKSTDKPAWERVESLQLSRGQSKFLTGYTFVLDQQMGGQICGILSRIVAGLGGSTNSDPIISQVRSFHLGGLTVTNGDGHNTWYWLFEMIQLDSFVPSVGKLVYRSPPGAVFESRRMSASYSNFYALQRHYVRTVCRMLGIIPTPELTRANEILVTRSRSGRKYTAATTQLRDRCSVVNYLWLEDCLRLGEAVDTAGSRYAEIPVRVSEGGNMLGQIGAVQNSVSQEDASGGTPETQIDLTQSDGRADDNFQTASEHHRDVVTSSPSGSEGDDDSITKPGGNVSANHIKLQIEDTESTQGTMHCTRPEKRIGESPVQQRSQTEEGCGAPHEKPIDNRDSHRPYQIEAVTTNCLERLTAEEKQRLGELGVSLHDDVATATPHRQLNCIIAPKRLRTVKFLTSLSFHPLQYALVPQFVEDLLALNEKPPIDEYPDAGDPQYRIPEVDPSVMALSALPARVFPRAGIHRVNLAHDIAGGSTVVAGILRAHGIQETRTLPRKFQEGDILKNEAGGTTEAAAPDYVLVATRPSQARRFQQLTGHAAATALVVEWNWCVQSIFDLQCNTLSSEYIIR
ncbi:uncharacterized protein KNAG_0A01550 [Huiozyma naganishii CBS 8797]|uniref:BRCT domain-containing protein n=1 Tax=Huiozyma naganishii (strain ATCC MYA-139 / BCRC 22969 / CBS 8797 / KCTC 17520 / NBRC 10181 / NCYC 3082 / Yp74L-3) TaxID=1071383 RepID=J7S1V3_HUIN7|nr:hypothetical protein KNAG_0A01550 [Kazachstania naganishii CBS 8797]CCK67844.1 hypothetical protein KNAG_0A01550 [Kazachstania naganishii CBS 8797]